MNADGTAIEQITIRGKTVKLGMTLAEIKTLLGNPTHFHKTPTGLSAEYILKKGWQEYYLSFYERNSNGEPTLTEISANEGDQVMSEDGKAIVQMKIFGKTIKLGMSLKEITVLLGEPQEQAQKEKGVLVVAYIDRIHTNRYSFYFSKKNRSGERVLTAIYAEGPY